MAVTQLLARISPDRLARCGRDRDALRDLIEQEFDASEDLIDVNWTPRGLCNALDALGKSDTSKRLATLFSGDDAPLVNKDHPEGPNHYDFVYSSITYVEANAVAQLFEELRTLDPDAVGAAVNNTYEEGAGYPPAPSHAYTGTFKELLAFLEKAVAAGQAVAAWWD